MRRLALLALALFSVATIAGCSYGGVATTSDGNTVYIARNGLLNFGRRIYKCSVSGNDLTCTAMEDAP